MNSACMPSTESVTKNKSALISAWGTGIPTPWFKPYLQFHLCVYALKSIMSALVPAVSVHTQSVNSAMVTTVAALSPRVFGATTSSLCPYVPSVFDKRVSAQLKALWSVQWLCAPGVLSGLRCWGCNLYIHNLSFKKGSPVCPPIRALRVIMFPWKPYQGV